MIDSISFISLICSIDSHILIRFQCWLDLLTGYNHQTYGSKILNMLI